MSARWVENILAVSLGLKPGERLMVICDRPLLEAGEALVASGRRMGGITGSPVVLPWVGAGPTLVPTAFVRAVQEADLLVTLRSGLDLAGEDPYIRAAMSGFRQAGRGRWASLAQVDEAVLAEELSGDFGPIAAEAERLAGELRRGHSLRLTGAAGTDLTLSYGGRPIHVETGQIRTPGSVGNLPAGEVYVAPLESSAEGRLVVDIALGDIRLDRPVTLALEQGRVVAVEGGLAADELRSRLGEDPWGWTVGEFGLGANPRVRPRGRVAIDEKALGTAHIALGGNRSFGGQNPAETHYDCVISGAGIVVG